MANLSISNKRRTAWVLIILQVTQLLAPFQAFALTSGPASPEFSSFEPVTTTQMVNEFTGDFTYNLPVVEIPGPEGSGYSLSLAYHSGTTPEEEASWVGYGWSLNPGAILRGKQGFPDDIKNAEATYYNDVPANWTAEIGGHAGNIEAFGVDLPLNLNASLRYNNYKGYGYTAGLGISLGVASLGYSIDDGDGSFNYSVNPASLLNQSSKKGESNETERKDQDKKTPSSNKNTLFSGLASFASLAGASADANGSQFGFIKNNWSMRPTSVNPYTAFAANVAISGEVTGPVVPIGAEVGLTGSFSRQKNKEIVTRKTFGYLYGGSNGSADGIMDYYLEKESPYQKRDKFLAIPFGNPDQYSVTGEGLGGGFRPYHRNVGHFYPNEVESTTEIVNLGLELQAGGNIGAGADLGVGSHTLGVSKWLPSSGYAFPESIKDANEPVLFRFTNDLGGNRLLSSTDAPENASVSSKTPNFGNTGISGVATSDMSLNATQATGRVGRASYIGWHTNEDMRLQVGGKYYKSYEKNAVNRDKVNRQNGVNDGIGEFSMTNEDGMSYVFGLPVYARNEKNIRYGFKNLPYPTTLPSVYANVDDANNLHTKVGEEQNTPYATAYLLTSIFTPDYVDINADGPTPNDFGGYTTFTYDRPYGTNDKMQTGNWYHWRMPYNGLSYDHGEISNPKDDLCGYQSGEKEVYYLQKIETKTHVARFITSSREDGTDAAPDSDADQNSAAKGTHGLKKLDAIQLFAKDPANPLNEKLLQTIKFQYANNVPGKTPVMPNQPNSTATTGNKGKLTLIRVWTEYENVANAKIAPYEFEYNYFTGTYPAPYNVAPINNYGLGLLQNPDYAATNLDPWGNYQASGVDRYKNQRNWVNQKPGTDFDPAAWQLKVIRLPSGGEIHVQYEQDDYQYVQDRRALAMVRLKSVTNCSSNNFEKFYLDVDTDLGTTNLDILKEFIQKEFIEKRQKIYFKFLFSLIGSGVTPTLNCLNSEYITGYAKIVDVGKDINGLYIKLGDCNCLGEGNGDPRCLCKQYVKANRAGMLKLDQCAEDPTSLDATASPKDIAQSLIGLIGTTFSNGAVNCRKIEPSLSYLRIPLLSPKKGGGLRVKHLLMYDQDPKTGEKVLFGNEYVYQTKDDATGEIISSGVATNEPPKSREENALVVPIEKRNDQHWLERIVAGRDKEQFEGPLGETILPSAAVGYSKVIVKNIHSGKTNPGFTVKTFYTSKDFPFDAYYPNLDTPSGVAMTELNEADKEWLVIPGILYNYSKTNLWLTQGFSFIQTDFNGKPRSIATYSGDYQYIHDLNRVVETSKQVFEYFMPGEKIPMMTKPDLDLRYWALPGKDMDIAMEGRKIEDITENGNIEGDANASVTPIPIPFVTAIPAFSHSESKLYTHVTSKIISYPAIVKSVTNYQDGILSVTENMGFHPDNGRPVLTRTTDGYQGLDLQQSASHRGNYFNFEYAASTIYPGLGQKAISEGRIFANVSGQLTLSKSGTIAPYSLNIGGTSSIQVLNSLFPGDLVLLTNVSTGTKDFYHIGKRTENSFQLLNNSYQAESAITGQVSVEVLLSSRGNRLNENAGKLTVYGNKLDILNYSDPLAINAAFIEFLNTQVLPGSPGNYPYNNGVFFKKDSTCMLMTDVSVIKYITNALGNNYNMTIQINYGRRKGCIFSQNQNKLYDNQNYFSINNQNYLVFNQYESPPKILECLFCNNGINIKVVPGVIDVDISTYSDDWPVSNEFRPLYDITTQTLYESGQKGKWRPDAQYVYKEKIRPATGGSNRIYTSAGTFDMVLFDWENLTANNPEKWIRSSKTTIYSPNGQALEEEDIQGLKSAARYGYKQNMPCATAQNAAFNEVYFESFENNYSTGTNYKFEDNWQVDAGYGKPIKDGHGGDWSLGLKPNKTSGGWLYFIWSILDLKPVILTQHIKDKGLLIRFWMKTRNKTGASMSKDIVPSIVGNHNTQQTFSSSITKIAQTGEWSLYESLIKDFGSSPVNSIINMKLWYWHNEGGLTKNPNGSFAEEIFVDDVRFQPADAQMNCYVYDPATYRVATTFDDQHFGLYYQYNAEGKLVRKIVETERGTHTAQETQYNTPLKPRQ